MTIDEPENELGPLTATRRSVAFSVEGLVPHLVAGMESPAGPLKCFGAFAADVIGSRRRCGALLLDGKLDGAGYGVRLVDSNGRMEPEIPLLSLDVADALKEVCLHSPDRRGFEFWREGRLILRFYSACGEGGS